MVFHSTFSVCLLVAVSLICLFSLPPPAHSCETHNEHMYWTNCISWITQMNEFDTRCRGDPARAAEFTDVEWRRCGFLNWGVQFCCSNRKYAVNWD